MREIITVHESGIMEACPTNKPLDAETGFFFPNLNQLNTILAPTGRLNVSLNNDSIVQWGDASATLAAAAVFRLIFLGHASVPFGFGGADNPDLATAIADLSITGENNYQNF